MGIARGNQPTDIDGDPGSVDGDGIAGPEVGEGNTFVVRLPIPWHPFEIPAIFPNVCVIGVYRVVIAPVEDGVPSGLIDR